MSSSVGHDAPRPASSASASRFYVAWGYRHAVLMIGGCAAAAKLGRGWPLVLVALVSFATWLWRSAGTFTPRGDFGAANAVTALRLTIALALGLLARGLSGPTVAAVLVLFAALDAVDGWIARRLGTASPFGAAFDMETDALLILIADLQLWQRGRLGPWILITGLLRYVYVLAIAVAPPPSGPAPRSRLGRLAFLALLAGLTAAFARADAVGTVLAAAGSAAVVASFARGFLWSYRRS